MSNRVRFSEGVVVLFLVLMLGTATAMIAFMWSDGWLEAAASSPTPPASETVSAAGLAVMEKAMDAARKQHAQACVEVTDPPNLAGWYCVTFHSTKPRGTQTQWGL